MASLRSIAKAACAGSQLLLAGSTVSADYTQTCSNTGPLSCQNTTVQTDLCCFNAPGGQLLQTQFWDTNPPTGPSNSWTVHGLWPDHCDGTYDSSCDPSRAYTDITSILQSQAPDTLSYMQTYWKDYQGNDESFWEHEWSKHGTCVSTLSPSCYTNYVRGEEAADFFTKTVSLFKALPTYDWLAAAGITPSNTATYTADQIQSALQAQFGKAVIIGCSSGVFDEVWYGYNVRGSIQTGSFEAADPDGTKSSCPATGIKYPLKSASTTSGGTTLSTATKTSTSTSVAPTSTSVFSGKGYLNAVTSGATKGCIISGGTWYTTGTCATFTATASGSGFTLKSSKGLCAVSNGALTCASTVTTGTVFSHQGSNLAYTLSGKWYADAVPSGSTQGTVYTSSSHAVNLTIQWQGL